MSKEAMCEAVYIQCAIAIVLAHGANASGNENYLPVSRANCPVAPSSRPPKCRTDDLNLNLEVTRVVCCPVGWRFGGGGGEVTSSESSRCLSDLAKN